MYNLYKNNINLIYMSDVQTLMKLNYINVDKHNKYYCSCCNIFFVRLLLHIKKNYHKQNLDDFNDYVFIVYF
jgi:hypothetical protein